MSAETLSAKKADVIKGYHSLDEKGQSVLKAIFGSETFSQKITDQVKSFEDACTMKGLDPAAVVKQWEEKGYEPHEIAGKKIELFIQVVNEGWVPDWSNSRESKWTPWFEYKNGELVYLSAYYWYSSTVVSSRLCLRSSELAKHAGTCLLKEYNQFFLINN
jgi:hypothetical protein